MTIEKITNGTELTVKLAGRLDTTTAPELEVALKDSYAGVEKLVLDFAELEYLSSAGLRVLLGAQKTMNKQGEMVVKNVNGAYLRNRLQHLRILTNLSNIVHNITIRGLSYLKPPFLILKILKNVYFPLKY